MKQYKDQLREILAVGELRGDRTGTGAWSIFGTQSRYDLNEKFPATTCKRLAWKTAFKEMLWMLSGSVDVGELQASGVKIWDEWAKPDGTIGPGYGKQFRDCDGVDQLAELVRGLEENPTSRRHIIDLWNVRQITEMSLPPCHLLSQFYVSADGRLSCQLYQRSADMFLGLPFNVAGYSYFTHLLARHCGLEVGEFIHTIGDAHIYQNHEAQVREVLARPRPFKDSPQIVFRPDAPTSIFKAKIEHVTLVGYHPHPTVKAPVAV